MSLLEQLRRAVDECGTSRYAVCKGSSVDQGVMSRFMAGGGLEVRTAEAIADHLGFTVELKRKDTVLKRVKRSTTKG